MGVIERLVTFVEINNPEGKVDFGSLLSQQASLSPPPFANFPDIIISGSRGGQMTLPTLWDMGQKMKKMIRTDPADIQYSSQLSLEISQKLLLTPAIIMNAGCYGSARRGLTITKGKPVRFVEERDPIMTSHVGVRK